MKPFRDCTYSAFVSYAHADDQANSGWISNFHDELLSTLKARLKGAAGRDVPGMHLSGRNGPVAGSLGRELMENVAGSYAMIIVVGEHYLSSGWCLKELEYFRSLAGDQGFLDRLYVVAISEPAIGTLARLPAWQQLTLPDQLWIPFFRDSDPERPTRIYLDNGALTERFETQLDRVLKHLVTGIKQDAMRSSTPAGSMPERRTVGGAAVRASAELAARPILVGVPAPELAEAVASLTDDLRAAGVPVQLLGPDALLADFPEFDGADTLVLPFGTGGEHLKPFKYMPGGHLAAQRDAWLDKGRPPTGLIWLDLREVPIDAPPGKGHAELIEQIGHAGLTPRALKARFKPVAPAVDARDEPETRERIHIYIESNQNEVDLWDDLGERIKEKWDDLVRQTGATRVPPIRLHARGLPLQNIEEERLDDADGIVLLWGAKTEDSLRAQIKKVESKLPGDAPPGIVAYLMPQREDPQRTIEAAYWKVLRFRDADTPRIDIVPPEADRLDRFLLKILQRVVKRQRAADATAAASGGSMAAAAGAGARAGAVASAAGGGA